MITLIIKNFLFKTHIILIYQIDPLRNCSMKFNDELTLFLKARYPIIYINTIEEDRIEYVIRKNIKTNLNRSIYSWDFVDGYTNNPNNEGFGKRNPLQALELVERLSSETPALFILKDFNRFLTDLSISRKLRNISRILKLQPKTIIIIGSELNIPAIPGRQHMPLRGIPYYIFPLPS